MQKNSKNSMDFILNGPIYKGLFVLAIPILIGNILQGSLQFVDAYWISKISTEAVAASAVSGSVYFLILSIGTGFSMAWTILIAQFAGAKNTKMVNKYASQTLMMDIFLALILGILGFFSAETILQLMKVAPDVIVIAKPFLQITFLWMVFSFIFSMFQSILRGVGEVRFPMYLISVAVVLNMILNPIFIFGWWFIPKMGMTGAAWTTMLVQFLAATVSLVVLFRGTFGVKISLRDMIPDANFAKKIFFLGLPSSVEMSLRSFGMILMTALVTGFGTIAVAAYGAGGYIFQLIFFPVMGFSIATSTMIGQNWGAKKFSRADEIAKKSMILSFGVLSVTGLLIHIFAPWLVGLFLKSDASPESLQIAVELMRMNAWSFGFMGVQFGLTGVFRAVWNATLAMNLGLVSMFAIQFPLAFLLSRTDLWVNGIWLSYAVTSVLMALITFFIFKKGDWKKKQMTDDEKIEEKILEETMVVEGK